MKRKKHAVTLIEIMIVILIIGLISGVLAYNFRGSLDKGKVFKSEHGAEQVKNILMLAVAEGETVTYVTKNWKNVIEASSFAAKPKELLQDGWGEAWKVTHNGEEIVVTSDKYEAYKKSESDKKAAKKAKEG